MYTRAQTYGMMVVSKADSEVECEFRHLSLAEYLSALYIHTTGTHRHTTGTHRHTKGTHRYTTGTHRHTTGAHRHTTGVQR